MRTTGQSIACAILVAASLAGSGCGRESRQAPAVAADSTQVVRRRITALEAARSFGGGELQRQLQHPDARVRRAAIVALGRIQDIAALPVLLPLVESLDASEADQAAFAIGQLQGYDDASRHLAQAALVAKVADHPEPQNAVFVEALGRVGGPETVSILEQSLATGVMAGMGSEARDPVLEGMAALGLARIKTPQARAALAQVGKLGNRYAPGAWRIGAAMMADPDTAFFASAVSLLDHTDSFARAQGARTLGRLGDPRALHPLVQHLADLRWEVRASILAAVAELANPKHPDREVVDFCASLTDDAHPLVREAAVVALDSFALAGREAMVRDRLVDRAPAVRLVAARALCNGLGSRAADAFTVARRDSVEFVRTDILTMAGKALGNAEALDSLNAAVRSRSARERAAACTALGTLRPPAGRAAALCATLETALRDPDFVVAASAAEALGVQHSTASIAALAAAYDTHHTSHNDVDVRSAVVDAAAAMADARSPKTLRALLESARSDADVRIAHSAEVGLAKLDGHAAPPVPAPRARDTAIELDSLPDIDLGMVAVRLVTTHGSAILELDGDRFPRTVGSFLHNIDTGVYAHGVFHRVVPSFVVQGGDPRGDGWGDAGHFLPCEYGDLRYDNAGVVGMAHAGKDTGGSQFFITHVPVPRLDGRYTAFGRVREGMDVVDAIIRGDTFHVERVAPVATP